MLIISNHVKSIGMDYPKDAIVRINLAWIKDMREIDEIITMAEGHQIFLDMPTGRTKPPKPTCSITTAVEIARTYSNHVSYFACSNAEQEDFLQVLRLALPSSILLVPKIETTLGVERLLGIISAAKTDVISLDKEDLYVDCDMDAEYFDEEVDIVRSTCRSLGVKCLELQGVIFA